MKNNFLIFSLLLFLFSSCDGKDDNVESYFIQLSQNEIAFDYKEGKDTIELKTNTSWEIVNIPDWLIVSKQKGTKEDTEVVIAVQKNSQSESREFELIFQIKGKNEKIRILQEAKPKPEYTLPRLGFSSLTRLISGTYSETEPFELEYEADQLFINSSNKEAIFLGNLFSSNLTNYPKLSVIKGYAYNLITIGIGYGQNFSRIDNFMPSYEAYQKIEKESIDKHASSSSLSLSASNGTNYYSRRHLHCIGLYELGISLDKLLNGKSYKEESMKHEYGLIYPITHKRFGSFMDFPYPSLFTEELSKEKYEPLHPNYVAEISYGNNSLLLVESDFDRGTVNSLKSKLSNKGQLDAEEVKKAQQIDAYYIYMVAAGEFNVIKGNLIEVIEQLNDPKIAKPVIVPVSFGFSDYYTNGVGSVTYKIHVE
ncbi:BACON domain-containing protein [Dysgonomonas sp. HGC4]|uniref:BACON domain-containing protein n=1 Tax=Dysgonomonas sp. HGC4 TaxID=1658009 RepID=UPI000680FF47|nr:BACON domain-containing protein [Dysgonomonas sp. HGC4]MBD8346698.1 BACON domain-containing protein [Dysgonomonas sp. HGC4]